MGNMFNWVVHSITGCPGQDVGSVRYGITHCNKCGRVNFIGDSLPRIARYKRPKKRLKLNGIT